LTTRRLSLRRGNMMWCISFFSISFAVCPSCRHTPPPTASTQPTLDSYGPFWSRSGPWHAPPLTGNERDLTDLDCESVCRLLIYSHCRRLFVLLSPKAENHFTISQRIEGWVKTRWLATHRNGSPIAVLTWPRHRAEHYHHPWESIGVVSGPLTRNERERCMTFIVVSRFHVDVFCRRLLFGRQFVELSSAFITFLQVSLADAIHFLLDVVDDLLLRLPLLLDAQQQVAVDQTSPAAHDRRMDNNNWE